MSARDAARDLVKHLRDLRRVERELADRDWWDGPPPHLVTRRDEYADLVADAVRRIVQDES